MAYALAHGGHHAGELVARRNRVGRLVFTFVDVNIGAADTGSRDFDEHFAWAGSRIGHWSDMDTARGRDEGSVHGRYSSAGTIIPPNGASDKSQRRVQRMAILQLM
jgi:hypothetical protein